MAPGARPIIWTRNPVNRGDEIDQVWERRDRPVVVSYCGRLGGERVAQVAGNANLGGHSVVGGFRAVIVGEHGGDTNETEDAEGDRAAETGEH